jgi:hypothetical protein
LHPRKQKRKVLRRLRSDKMASIKVSRRLHSQTSQVLVTPLMGLGYGSRSRSNPPPPMASTRWIFDARITPRSSSFVHGSLRAFSISVL